MNAKLAVQLLAGFVLFLQAISVEGADVNVTVDSQKDKVPGDSTHKNPTNNLDHNPVSNTSITSGKDNAKADPSNPKLKPSDSDEHPSGANVEPNSIGAPASPKATTAIPRSIIAVIKTHTFPPKPTLPLIGVFATNNQNVTCIVLKAGIRFTVDYRNASGGQMVNQSVLDVPVHNYTVEGQCNLDRQSISIVFFPDLDLKWNLTFEFQRNATDKKLAHSEKIYLEYELKTGSKPFPWSKTLSTTAAYSTPGFFSLTLGSSYICLANSRVSNFTKSPDSHVTEMRLYGLQIQAFKTEKNSTDFSAIIVQCSGDAVSSTVPLIVGLFILVLIVTVLIVFILRRRMMGKRTAHKKLPTEEED